MMVIVIGVSVVPILSKKEPATSPEKKTMIIIVPGHESKSGGAVFLDRKERNMVVTLAEDLKEKLQADGRFEIMLTRDKDGFLPPFDVYFKDRKEEIQTWMASKKEESNEKVASGTLKEVVSVEHNKATPEEALHLYGINKWANENHTEVIIHLHINDDVRKKRKIPGKYSGFTMYIPEKQYQNSTASRVLAEKLLPLFDESYNQSTLPVEKGGIIESQKLIALGRYGTLDVPTVLIETGFIYEPIFATSTFETVTSKTMADTIYRGLIFYLFP